MVLPFKKEIVNDLEYTTQNFYRPKFIGYINKYGQVLNYSDPLGIGGHDDNKMTTFFERYFRMPEYNEWDYTIHGTYHIDLENEKYMANKQYNFFKTQIESIKEYTEEYGLTDSVETRFTNDLYYFFLNCYQADTFMDGFGQNCMKLNQKEFKDKYNKNKSKHAEYYYHWYKKNLMLDWYKIVIVQYMHYHLVERCEKGITTSDLRPTETFYNYLLNDFTIHQIPRMIYDTEKKKYVQYNPNPLLIPDSELRLQEEINSIKKLVPIEEREKYYR